MAEIRTAIVQTEPKAVVAIGTHLCGALSPRLIDVTLRLPAIHALILSPCCLKGSLGASIARVAKEAKPEVVDGPYHLLVASLAELTRGEMRRNAASSADEVQCEPCEEGEEDGGGGSVTIEYDAEVLSPKNAFIVVEKARRGGCLVRYSARRPVTVAITRIFPTPGPRQSQLVEARSRALHSLPPVM